MKPHLKLLVEFGVHVQPDEYWLCEACGGHRGCRGVTVGQVPQAPSRGPRPQSCSPSSLTGSGELHQHFGQRGGEQDCLLAPRKAADDFLQLLCKPHFEEPARVEGGGQREGWVRRRASTVPTALPPAWTGVCLTFL